MRVALPRGVRQPLFGLLGRVYPKADWAPRVFRAKTTFEALARTSVEAYFHTRVDPARARCASSCSAPAFKRAARRLRRAARCSTATPRSAGTDDPLALVQYLDLKTYLVGDINTKVDRASMAHSLEVREPLMDHQLVEWLATLPSRPEGARPGRQVPAEEGDGAAPAARGPVPAEDGLRGAAGALVPRAAASSACATPCSASAWRRTGLFDRELPAAPGRRAPDRRARLQLAAVDAADVRGVPAQRDAAARAGAAVREARR